MSHKSIKHIVLSGGGHTMIQTLGLIEHLEENNIIHLNEIETIYATSAGAIVAILMSLKFDWDTINDYIIKRPWQDLFTIKIQDIFEAYTKKGIFTIDIFEKCFKPLFDAKDISMNITLREFWEYSHIEIHFFTFEINQFVVEDISYLTHPELPLLRAIQMTCALPVLVSPVCIENKCYVDGGVICNYPLQYCIEKNSENIDEILGIKNQYHIDENSHFKNNIQTNSTLLDFVMTFLFKLIYSFNTDHKQPKIKNEIICHSSLMSIHILKSAISSAEVRKELLESGIESAKLYIEKTKEKESC